MIITKISYQATRQVQAYTPHTINIEAELSPEIGEDGKQKEKASDVLNSLKKFAISHLYLDVPAERDKLLVQMLPKVKEVKSDPSQQMAQSPNHLPPTPPTFES